MERSYLPGEKEIRDSKPLPLGEGRVGKLMKHAREIHSLMKTDRYHTFHAD